MTGVMKGGSSPHHPRQPSSGHSSTGGPNFARPMISAPMPCPHSVVSVRSSVTGASTGPTPWMNRPSNDAKSPWASPIGASKLTYVPAA